MKRRYSIGTLLSFGGALVLAGSSVMAGAQTAPTREEILRQPSTGTEAQPRIADIQSDDDIERAPCPLAAPEFANVRFTLNNVVFDNSGPIDVTMLATAWEGQRGTEVPIATICDIRDRAATILRREGYLAAVRVPVQTINDGVVHLEVLAAHLSGIQIRGDAGRNERQLARYLGKLQEQPLFNAHQAERYLLLANSIPGVSARLTLRPAGTPGQVIGEVTVQRTPWTLEFNAQDYGSHSVGRWGGIVRARINGLTGMGDSTTLGLYSTAETDEQQVLQAGHEFRIGGEGLTFETSLTHAWTSPTIAASPDIHSRTLVVTNELRYPLVYRQSRAVWLGGGLDWIDQNIRSVGIPLSRDHLRIVWARLTSSWSDPAAFTGRGGYTPSEPMWSAALSAEARKGLGGLGASDYCGPGGPGCGAVPTSRIEGRPTAFVLRASGEFTFRPHPRVAVVAIPRAQYSHRALLAYEEFSAGNFTVGRGYDPGTLSGDSGIGSTFELRVGTQVPRTRQSVVFQPYAFFDVARVWNRDSSFAGLNPQRLESVGGGVRTVFGDRARLDIGFAEPLRKVGTPFNRPATRMLVSLTAMIGARR